MDATLQTIFQDGYEDYKKQHGMTIDQQRAARAIMTCRSEGLGYDEWVCPNGDHVERQPHSCRHRSCPRCHGSQSHAWLEKVKARLLPIDHYHVIFTLPHELNPLWQMNRRWCTDRLFKACTETLSELLRDERYLGAEVGMLCALHTWGRTLTFHPHLHVLVSGGGLQGQRYRAVRQGYLLPVGVVKAKFRGKWLDWLNRAYAAGELTLPPEWTHRDWIDVLRKVAGKSWNLRIDGPYGHGRGVAKYLSRYVNGGPITDRRIVTGDAEAVRFRYRDHRDGGRKTCRLSTDHFIRRVLWHVPVKGQHQVRYYGLYVAAARDKRDRLRELIGVEAEAGAPAPTDSVARCPECGASLLRRSSRARGNSYLGYEPVQQAVQVDRDGPSLRRVH